MKMKILIGMVFLAGGIVASFNGLALSAVSANMFGLYFFIMSKLDDIEDKLK